MQSRIVTCKNGPAQAQLLLLLSYVIFFLKPWKAKSNALKRTKRTFSEKITHEPAIICYLLCSIQSCAISIRHLSA